LFESGVDVSDVVVNFANPAPTMDEKDLAEQMENLLVQGQELLGIITGYEDCGLSIRRALSNPTHENENDAFQAVKRNAETINGFYQYSKQLEDVFPRMLEMLATDDEKKSIQDQQTMAKHICQLLDFVLKFDEIKMLRPGMQNDFSFYRRALGKHDGDPDLIVRDDMASFISLFLAQPIPMMTALSNATHQLLTRDAHMTTHVPKVLATIANVCLHMVKSGALEADKATSTLCLRAMVGAIVLFDHVTPDGAFVKRSGINIKQAVTMIVKDYPGEIALINALRYGTLHFSDDSTPSSIATMLENA